MLILLAVGMHGCQAVADSDGEWTYLTSDAEETCTICGGPIRAAQAAGYVDGTAVHARCYRPLEPEDSAQ